jgi:hypothetical protein
MRIYKARNQDVRGALDEHAGLEIGEGLVLRQYGNDPPISNSNGVVLEDLISGLYGDAPAR